MRRPRPDGGFTSRSWQAPPPPFSVLWLSSGNSERAKKRRGGSARPRSMRRPRPDGGFLTIWMLGLCLLLLVLGGVSLDLWRAFSQRQALAGLADAAALAGASGIDRAAARRGVIRLDPAEATSLANRSIEGQADRGSLVSSNVTVSQDGSEVTVSADGRVLLTLLRLVSGQGPIAVHVSSTALARRSQ